MLDFVPELTRSLTYLHCSQDKLDRIVRYWRVVGFEGQIQRNLGADKPVFGTRVWRFREKYFPATYGEYTNHQDNVQYFFSTDKNILLWRVKFYIYSVNTLN